MVKKTDNTKKVLVLSHDTTGRSMAGPGIRYAAVAREFTKHFDVTLAILNGSSEDCENIKETYGISVEPYDEYDFHGLIDENDYIFAQQISPKLLRYSRAQKKRIIIDLYAPVPVEFLLFRYFSSTGFSSLEKKEYGSLIDTYREYVSAADYFVCSNNRQRDLWAGFFLANNILEDRQDIFTDIDRLIGLSPMGIDSDVPKQSQSVLRGIIDGIEQDDFILLWTGGIWDWFDALNVVKAVEHQHKKDPRIKLVFLGIRHPNKKIPNMKEAKRTISYVKEQGLEKKCVFFIDEWLPYEERVNYLLEADAAIYAHKPSLETRYSHRTRVLDHIYASLPTIATPGDFLGDEVIAPKKLGIIADNTVEGLAGAIEKLSNDQGLYEQIKKNINACRKEFFWENTLQPLTQYIKEHDPTSPIAPKNSFVASRNEGPLFHLHRAIRKVRRHVL